MKSSAHRAAVQATQIYCTCGLSLLTVCCIRNLLRVQQKQTGTDAAKSGKRGQKKAENRDKK